MARLSTDQWLGTLLGTGAGDEFSPARSGGMSDEELLATLTQRLPPEAPPPPMAPQPVAPLDDAQPIAGSAAPTAPAPRSREEMLLASLQRPTGRELGMAAMFDSLVGGTRHSDDARARRNMFDQARIGALTADAGSAERAAESAQGRDMQREQMEITRRGQNLADKRYEEQRKLQDLLASRRDDASMDRQKERDASALERAKVVKHGAGTGAPSSPEERANREQALADMEASYLAGSASSPGKKAVTIEQARAFQANPSATEGDLGVTSDQLEMMRRSEATLRGLKATDGKAYAQLIKAGESREAGTGDAIGKGAEAKKLDPKVRLALKQEVSDVGSDINDARGAWKNMSDSAQNVFAQYAGAGGDLAQTIKSARLSPEDQRYAGSLQALANALVKARAGSAVTGSEWNRVAQEIGWPTGDWSFFNSTAAIDGFLQKSSRAWTRRVANIKSEYGDIWGSDG